MNIVKKDDRSTNPKMEKLNSSDTECLKTSNDKLMDILTKTKIEKIDYKNLPLEEEDELNQDDINDIVDYLKDLDYDKYAHDMEIREALELLKSKMIKDEEEKKKNETKITIIEDNNNNKNKNISNEKIEEEKEKKEEEKKEEKIEEIKIKNVN